ncbi:KPN_02809 family neutral zinc metallopeptidase [Litoreibacter arenae]|uniref:YpfJ protein, zinc metalloprotease superfamily n=1 Tax=Litoreibacter arenae DSM 19593 TaxID=1123360 RepID=S9RYP4_9RHOB|nr:neutral zinc metallopeptidase [Litoreibacter arenae]EPX79084.1 YpfJ protein, zinc metalloprotease superfamily [Litoreibacter arenae DSM 19593]
MRWKGRRGSRNIEDRRTQRGSVRAGKAGGIGGLGLLAIVVVGYFLGVDVTPLLQATGGGQVTTGGGEITEADRQAGQFVSVVLADTEEVWTEIFHEQVGQPYNPATLVLFKGATQSPCGGASGASGPFYCPADNKAYLDTEFFTTLSRRLGASGDFAAAYVVAHEIAHHVQDELGILSQANRIRQQVSEAESNAISVRIELQADCLSGVWARYAQARFNSLENGDLKEAVNAAKQIGDDTLQRNAGRRPNPHSFTHGTSEQRQRWFSIGYKEASIQSCDTFSTDRL